MTGKYPETKRLLSALHGLMPSPFSDSMNSSTNSSNTIVYDDSLRFRVGDIAKSLYGLQSIDASKSIVVFYNFQSYNCSHIIPVLYRLGCACCDQESWIVSGVFNVQVECVRNRDDALR